jgi:hypothetical protein
MEELGPKYSTKVRGMLLGRWYRIRSTSPWTSSSLISHPFVLKALLSFLAIASNLMLLFCVWTPLYHHRLCRPPLAVSTTAVLLFVPVIVPLSWFGFQSAENYDLSGIPRPSPIQSNALNRWNLVR